MHTMYIYNWHFYKLFVITVTFHNSNEIDVFIVIMVPPYNIIILLQVGIRIKFVCDLTICFTLR